MKTAKVLFVGNSHTFYNDMPTVFKMLCEQSGTAKVEAVMQAHPGVHLSWHLKQRWELRHALVQGNFDYMVFQQAAHPCPPKEETLADGAEMVRLARQAGVTPIATVTWAERRFPENQAKMYDIFDALHRETGVICSPVGQVFEYVLQNEPDIDLYWHDGEHCSPYGSYVVAACALAVIFDRSAVGLPCVSINNITGSAENMAEVQRKLAAAQADPDNTALRDEALALYGKYFSAVYDRDKLVVQLDPEKCARLQKIIDSFVTKGL